MKLLLTSGGIGNTSLKNALLELAGKPAGELNIVFVPTAANVESGDKSWLVKDLIDLKDLGPASLDIVDFSAVSREIWQPRLEAADLLVFGGGNTFHLMYHLEKSGLRELLPKLLETRVYVGISAGSVAAGKDLSLSWSERLCYDEMGEYKGKKGLGFVNFCIWPHLNSPYSPNVTEERLKEMAQELQEPMYALDDESAVRVVDGHAEVISEGKWIKYN